MQVGRWLGYSTAVVFALLSLYQIVKTFKRVLLFQVYMRKSAVEQHEMVDGLRARQSAGTRMLARVMTTMRPSSNINNTALQEDDSDSDVPSPFEVKAASGMRLRRTLNRSPTLIMPVAEHSPSAKLPASRQLSSRFDDAAATGSDLDSFREGQEKSLCVSIAQEIQRLEVGVAATHACLHLCAAWCTCASSSASRCIVVLVALRE